MIAKMFCVIYNIKSDGAWCSGSTWASDSHCVGSIPIAPANANTLTCEGVSFYDSALVRAHKCRGIKRNMHDSVFALSIIVSEQEAHL